MGKLVVVSPDDCHVSEPGFRAVSGGPARYVGREFDEGTGKYPVSRTPAEFHDDGSSTALRIRKLVVRGELLAADQDTAHACGVEYVPRRFDTIKKVWVLDELKAPKGSEKGSK